MKSPVSLQRRKVKPGVYRHRDGRWEVFIRITPLPLVHKWLEASLTQRQVDAWIEERKTQLRKRASSARVQKGTLAADVPTFLATLANRPKTRSEREYQLALWVEHLGSLPRWNIRPHQIQAVLAQWGAEGLAASTIRHRRMALFRLFAVLDAGTEAKNPVEETEPPANPEPEMLAIEFELAERVWKAMSDKGHGPGLGVEGRKKKKAPPSKAKARVGVILATGVRPEEVRSIQLAADWDRAAQTLDVRAAKGSVSRTVPLTAAGTAALEHFGVIGAEGRFSESTLLRAITKAVERLKEEDPTIEWPPFPINAYTFRHTFAADLYEATGDLARVQAVIGHVDIRMTRRYAKRAVPRVMRDSLAALEKFRTGRSSGKVASLQQWREKQA